MNEFFGSNSSSYCIELQLIKFKTLESEGINHYRRPFQICLSFYLHPNISDFIFVGDKMNISQSTQKGKRDELNSFKYFTQVIGAQIFAKHQFQLSNLNFTLKPALFSSAILSFFSSLPIFASTHKISLLNEAGFTFFVHLL